jgi:small-conductance mechanosensitive channel
LIEISTFIQDSLKIIWVIMGVSVLILALGWIISKIFARIFVNLLNRSSLIDTIVTQLKLSNAEGFNNSLRSISRVLFFLPALWGAWRTLISQPAINEFISSVWQKLLVLVELPAVIFLFDLVLIGVETYLLFKAIGWVRNGFILIENRIEAEQGKRVKGFKIQQVQVFTASQLTSFLQGVTKYTRYGVNFLLMLIYLTGIFSVFPKTRGVVSNILTSIFKAVEKNWQEFISYLPNLLNLIVIIAITYYGLKLIRFLFNEIEKGTITLSGFHAEWAMPTFQLVKFLVIALALVVAFPFLPGSSSPAFQGISVFIGLLFSLGSTSVVANVVSGVVLTYTRAFRVGDRVKIADTVGDVIEKGLLVTRVRTIKNVEITIPNGMVLGSHIINYSSLSQEQGLILTTTITLGYDVPWRLIYETLKKAALATEGILTDPPPFVLQTSLDDFYVSYELNAYTLKPNRMALIYSELHQNIQDACNEAGIEILSPHYGALRDGNPSTIPVDQLPKNYQAPPFQVKINRDRKKST